MKLAFTPQGWADLEWWMETDRKTLKRVRALIKETLRTPYEGTGKPEPLKHLGPDIWSRRITQEHRFVYGVESQTITVLALRFHY